MSTTLTVPMIAGVLGTFVTAIASRAHWPSTYTRLMSLVVYMGVAGLAWFATVSPDTWSAALSQVAVVVASGQIAYTALKPTGVLDWVEEFTTPVDERLAAHEAGGNLSEKLTGSPSAASLDDRG